MVSLLTALLVGISSFAATNIDDLVLITLFFSQTKTSQKRRAIVIGQYLGIAVLVGVSLVASLSALVIPEKYIGLFGLFPIFLGVKHFFTPQDDDAVSELPESHNKPANALVDLFHPDTYAFAAITVANGGDNIAIYTPLFASVGLMRLLLILFIYFGMVAVWCLLAYKLVQQPLLIHVLQRWDHLIVPLVLIGLGISILVESKALSVLI